MATEPTVSAPMVTQTDLNRIIIVCSGVKQGNSDVEEAFIVVEDHAHGSFRIPHWTNSALRTGELFLGALVKGPLRPKMRVGTSPDS